MKKMKFCDTGPWDHIHNILFSLYLMKGPNKLKCYSLVGLKGLQVTNTSAYFGHSSVTKKFKLCDNGLWDHIHSTLFSLYLMKGPNKLKCCITLVWKGLQA